MKFSVGQTVILDQAHPDVTTMCISLLSYDKQIIVRRNSGFVNNITPQGDIVITYRDLFGRYFNVEALNDWVSIPMTTKNLTSPKKKGFFNVGTFFKR